MLCAKKKTVASTSPASLYSLFALLKESLPHLVFLQEVSSFNILTSLAAASGYKAWASTLLQKGHDHIWATLSRFPDTTVTEFCRGCAQQVAISGLSFFNIHAPSDPSERTALFTALCLVGNFNCCQAFINYSSPVVQFTRQRNLALIAILADFSFTNSYRTLHPATVGYSYQVQGQEASRLDYILLPALLESRPKVACYIPTISDHHAYLLRLETAGLALLPSLPVSPFLGSLYWRLNPSLLADSNFLPAFKEMWLLLALEWLP